MLVSVKRHTYLGISLLVLGLILPLVSIGANYHWLGEGLTISSKNLDFTHKRAGQDFQIQTTSQWNLQTASPWISFSKLNGTGNATVQIKVLTNNATSERVGKVIINAGSLYDTLTIIQKGQPVTLLASPSTLQSGTNRQKFEIQVVANLPWQVLKHDSWIHIDEIRSSLIGKIAFTVEPSNGEARTGKLSISAAGQTIDVTINQANIITATEEEVLAQLNIYPNPASSFLMIEGNVDYYQLVDITGKIQLEDDTKQQNEIRVDTDNLSKGIYFMRLHTTLGSATQRIIIQ